MNANDGIRAQRTTPNRRNTRQLNLYVTPEMYDALKTWAAREDRSMSQQVRVVLRNALAFEEAWTQKHQVADDAGEGPELDPGPPCCLCKEPIEAGYVVVDDDGNRYCEGCWQP